VSGAERTVKRPSITLDVYGELWDESQEDLATALDVAIRNAGR
jgi:hypothetical protein